MRYNSILMRPIKQLMARLRLGKKFLIIISLSILGYIPGAYLIYTTTHDNKEVAESELEGANYFIPAFDLYKNILTTRNPLDNQKILNQLLKLNLLSAVIFNPSGHTFRRVN